MGAEGGFLTKQHLNECILRSPWSEYPLPPLHRACRDGDMQSLTYLVVQGDRLEVFRAINEPDQFLMWTPAHWAAYFGKLECLQRLVACGFSLDVVDGRLKQTAAHLAAFAGNAHVLLWLLQTGIAVDKQDSLGETVVHKAVRGGSVDCLALLQIHGAPMSWASIENKVIRWGSDVHCISEDDTILVLHSVPNSSQQLPYDIAQSLGVEQCVHYFRASGAAAEGSISRTACKRSRDDECDEGVIKRARNGSHDRQ